MNLPIPTLLRTLIESGRWCHPGDVVLLREIPRLTDPVDFRGWLPNYTVAAELEGSFSARDWEVSKMYRDDQPARPLPWLNADRAVLLAINRNIGDDVAIALDYRIDPNSPRVVASCYPNNKSVEWFEVAEDFETFARSLGLIA